MNSFKNELMINQNKIGTYHPVYFIADIAANHDGDLERAKDLIYQVAENGGHAAKFQHFAAKTIVSDKGFRSLGSRQSHQAQWKKSVYEVYDDAALKVDWTPILKETCDKAGIDFFTSPYSFDLVDQVDCYVPAYKVGSGDITWPEIIRYMAKKNKPMLIASGASTLDEVDQAVNACLEFNNQLVLMQCNTNYTASLENFKFINLDVLKTYRAMYPEIILGLSDHTPGHATVLGSIALGARVIEKHFTDDNDRNGPDHPFSMNPQSWKDMVERSRELEHALGCGVKKVEDNEKETVILQRRSIRLSKDLPAGATITREYLEVLRPCPEDGLPPYHLDRVIGKKLTTDKTYGDHLKWSDLDLA